MRKPDFFVVGAAKSGTTALWKYFQQHSGVFVTKNIAHKELGYYSNQYGVTKESIYLNFFKNAKVNQLIGEICHVYLSSEESSKWIKSEVPNAKIIILLRNPAERAFSLYNWMVMEGYENADTFKKALLKEQKLINGFYNESMLLHQFKQNYYYYNSGLYFEQVKRYYDDFGKENVLVMEYSDFLKNQVLSLKKIFNFLGLETQNLSLNKPVNISKNVLFVKLQFFLRKILLSKYGKNKNIKSLALKLMKKNIIQNSKSKFDEDIKNLLMKMYIEDVKHLSDLTSINFYEKWYA